MVDSTGPPVRKAQALLPSLARSAYTWPSLLPA
jgi:hypothetical protein